MLPCFVAAVVYGPAAAAVAVAAAAVGIRSEPPSQLDIFACGIECLPHGLTVARVGFCIGGALLLWIIS